MSFHWCDSNIHTSVFTPRDHQVELLAAAYERNTMVCLGHKSSKEFIAMKLIQEMSRDSRTEGSIYVYLTCGNTMTPIYTMLSHLTDLQIYQQQSENDTGLFNTLNYNVYIVHPHSVIKALQSGTLQMDNIQLLILEDCHQLDVYTKIIPIFKEYYLRDKFKRLPIVLGLAGPIHSANCDLEELGAMLNALENNVKCRAETASDIVTVLRYCAKPIEFIVQCEPFVKDNLSNLLEDIICTRIAFLRDHRYDPSEIYNTAEFIDEIKDIPDPKKDPLAFLENLLSVLHEMGPYSADRYSIALYHLIEKQKIQTPHERHYLLLNLVSTVLLEVHALCEQNFRTIASRKEVIEKYSSPKVLRLLEILRLFKPDDINSKYKTIQNINSVLEEADFAKITKNIEQTVQRVEVNTTKLNLESRSILENLDSLVKTDTNTPITDNFVTQSEPNAVLYNLKKNYQRSRHSAFHRYISSTNRTKRRIYPRSKPRIHHENFDSLCCIIFCNINYVARILHELITDISRNDISLKYLRCQYTTDRVADPLKDPKEAENEHRRQEDVLKRFRMHECNVLIATSFLEEGIDVPKCNLVVRWDAPDTYRSYVQCKGRARAAPAYHVILVSTPFDMNTNVQILKEELSDQNHRLLCINERSEDNESKEMSSNSSADEEDNENESNSKNSNSKEFTIASSKGTVKILNPEIITDKPPVSSNDKKELTSRDQAEQENEGSKSPKKLSLTEIKNENHLNNLNEPVTTISDATTINSASITSNTSTTTTTVESIMQSSNSTTITTNAIISTSVSAKSITESTKPVSGDIPKTDELFGTLRIRNLRDLLDECTFYNKEGKFIKIKQSNKSNKTKCSDICCIKLEDNVYVDNLYEVKLNLLQTKTSHIVYQLAQYMEIEKLLLLKCANIEPKEWEQLLADQYTHCIQPYKPLTDLTSASVDLSTSIALVNKYCSKLPSDTFTKLTALWRYTNTLRNDKLVHQYTIRLPINSPLKYDIIGIPMSSQVLARRMAALQTCIELHKMGELDDNLQPIGKEGFRALEQDWETFDLEEQDERIVQNNAEPRPGTTKRRQYYYKRIASEFCNCRPTVGAPCYLYFLDLTLQCPIPEEQNTRGRRIYPPEDAQQGFGILTMKKIPKVSSFPIFTRSGEVKVTLVLAQERVILEEKQISCINTFLNYTFTNVLRLQKFLMLFDSESTENCVFIVPTVKTDNGNGKVIDWDFLRLIEENATMMPTPVSDEIRKATEFDANKFKDAVVMPWYRNQDQPQYFYVAEICPQLSPLSCFPGENYNTFKHYYFLKYNLQIQNTTQPLLDVDHTSARLNFLTPRYVNRKGVALPTSSEETKRAKRENLEQKQILVPELCTVHPFPASLWRTAVCLPCILYRINALLLADDIRKKVSMDIGLGQQELSNNFEWPMLDFGWSLSEVLKKSKETKLQAQKDLEVAKKQQENTDKKESTLDDDENKKDIDTEKIEKSANEIIVEGEKKLQDENFVEIGTWTNDMVNDIKYKRSYDDDDEDAEYMNCLLSNVSFCDQQMRYGSPTFWDIGDKNVESNSAYSNQMGSQRFNYKNRNTNHSVSYYDSDESSYYSDGQFIGDYYTDNEEDFDEDGRIAFTSKHEAETIETEQEREKFNKKLSIIQATNENERNYQETKNLQVGYNISSLREEIANEIESSVKEFLKSTLELRNSIEGSNTLVDYRSPIVLTKKNLNSLQTSSDSILDKFLAMLPYADKDKLSKLLKESSSLTVNDIRELNLSFVRENSNDTFTVIGCGSVFDNFNDYDRMNITPKGDIDNIVHVQLNFEQNAILRKEQKCNDRVPVLNGRTDNMPTKSFSFDYQPDLSGHPGPSPSIILQGLTMSNANDGINLERLETIGDSFLKYAITTYLYITYENVHEGKLSHLRSKQVANLNLYRLGRRKMLGEYMIATKFEPHDNWLPPCYYVPKELEKALIEAKIPPHHWKLVDLPNIKKLSSAEICALVKEKADTLGLCNDEYNYGDDRDTDVEDITAESSDFSCFIPYNLVTQHSIPDKSVADCVEALIGAYLIECGSRGALLFMAWLGIRVLPSIRKKYDPNEQRIPGSTLPDSNNMITVYGEWTPPKSPLLHYSPNPDKELNEMLKGFDEFETILQYRFQDRSYLLQAMTHASYSPNRLTDCYQRLEFLGDAVLDYLITRHLYEDPRQHSPGALTDLRSALVNNTIFASLAVRHGFHKYFRHLSPGLNEVIDRFVRIQNENGHSISEEYYLLSEEECDDAEDVEVPKALGDVFESIAGAIFLDSNMSLDVVWKVYSNMMKPEIEQFSSSVPKSPIRELLELEPETAKFGKPEKLADGRRVRVTVDVFCKGMFRGIGRNYRIAKCTAAKCALRQLKKQGLISKKD